MVRYNKSIGEEIYELRESGATYSEIADVFDMAISTAYNYYKQYVEDAISNEDNDCSCTCGGKCKSHKGIDMSQFFDDDYDLLSGEELHIYPVGDWHIGSEMCNYEIIDNMVYRIQDDNMPKIIVGLGDYLEIGSKRVGNSSFNQECSVNEQMDILLGYLKPFKKNIAGMVSGNHNTSRLVKDYDFDIDKEIARSLGTMCYHRNTNKFLINNDEYSVYYKHGKGSLSRGELALSKLMRDNANVEANCVLNGHTHVSCWGSNVVDKGNNTYARRYYAYCGSMLNFKGSYGDIAGYSPLLPSYIRVNISDKLVTSVDIFNSDEVL